MRTITIMSESGPITEYRTCIEGMDKDKKWFLEVSGNDLTIKIENTSPETDERNREVILDRNKI